MSDKEHPSYPLTFETFAVGLDWHLTTLLNQRAVILNLEFGAMVGQVLDAEGRTTQGIMVNQRTPWGRELNRPLFADDEWRDDFVATASAYHGGIEGRKETLTTHAVITSGDESSPAIGFQNRPGSLVMIAGREASKLVLQTMGAKQNFLTSSIAAFDGTRRYGGAISTLGPTNLRLSMQLTRTSNK